MDCEQVSRRYRDYLLERLDPVESEKVAEHIRNCGDCFYLLDRVENSIYQWEDRVEERQEIS